MVAYANVKSLKLADYLGGRNLCEHLKITDGLSFHWASWDRTCLIQRKFYSKYGNLHHLDVLSKDLEALRQTPVWLCNKYKFIQSDLYALYESYLDTRLRMNWFDRKEEILFSYVSEHGPFFPLSSMKWFDKKIYEEFVLKKIILDFYPLRDFRLYSNIHTAIIFSNDFKKYEDKVVIHQLTEKGVVFKMNDRNFLNKLKNSEHFDLDIPVALYESAGKLPFAEMITFLGSGDCSKEKSKTYRVSSSIIQGYGNANNLKKTSNSEFYLFASYADIVSEGKDLRAAFYPVVEKIKSAFMYELEHFEVAKLEDHNKVAREDEGVVLEQPLEEVA